MSLEQRIEAALTAGFVDADVTLELSGNKALIEVVSEVFSGKSRVERSKLVYQVIDGFIRTGELHAVTIRAQTPSEHG
jgi:acid stress-induced BolA-like protein IbaG/YrbA